MRTASRAFARGLMRSSAACPCCEPVSAVVPLRNCCRQRKCAASGPGEHVGRCAGHDHVHDEHCGHGADTSSTTRASLKTAAGMTTGPRVCPPSTRMPLILPQSPIILLRAGLVGTRHTRCRSPDARAQKPAARRHPCESLGCHRPPWPGHGASGGGRVRFEPLPTGVLETQRRRARNARQRTGLHRPQGIEPTRSCRRCACAACGRCDERRLSLRLRLAFNAAHRLAHRLARFAHQQLLHDLRRRRQCRLGPVS